MSAASTLQRDAAGRDELLIGRVETDADRAELLALYHELYIVREGWDAALMSFYRDQVHGAAETWIARQDGRVVGGIAALLGPDGPAAAERAYYQLARFARVPGLDRIALATGLAVMPGSRIDTALRLLAAQFRWLAEQGVVLCFGNARAHRIGFYRLLGLRPYLPANAEPVMQELTIPLVAVLSDPASLAAAVRPPRPVAGHHGDFVLPPCGAVLTWDSQPRSPLWEEAVGRLTARGTGALAHLDGERLRRLLTRGCLFACPADRILVLANCREEGRLFVIRGCAGAGASAAPAYGPGAVIPAAPAQDIRILDQGTWVLWLPLTDGQVGADAGAQRAAPAGRRVQS
jgi:hypothetical protein